MQTQTRPTTLLGGNRAALLCLALTPVYYVVPWASLPGLRAVLGVVFVFLYAAVLPGFLIAPRVGLRGTDFLEKSALASLAGLAGFMAVSFVWALAGLSLGLLRLALPVVIVLLAGWVLARERFSPAFFRAAAPSHPAIEAGTGGPPRVTTRDKGILAVFTVVLVVTFAVVLQAGLPLMFTSDTLDHIGYVSEIAETQQLFPTTEFYLDPGSNGADLRKGLLHVFYGFTTAYLGESALDVLTMMNALLAVLLLLSVYTSARFLFGSRGIAMLSALVFLLALDEGLRGTAMRQSFYTHRFGIAFFLTAVAYGLRYVEKAGRGSPVAEQTAAETATGGAQSAAPFVAAPQPGRPRPLASGFLLPAAVLSFAAIAVHIFFGVLLAFAALTMLVWKFCFSPADTRTHLSRVLPVAFAFAAGVIPFGLYRYLTAFPEANDLHKEIQGVVFVTRHFYIANPYEVFRWFGPVGLLTFFAVFALWKNRARYAGLGFVAASYLTLIAIVFNPVLLPPVRSAMTYLIARLNVLVPFYFATALFLAAFFARENRKARRSPSGQLIGALLLVALAYSLVPIAGANGLSRAAVENERKNSYLRWEDGLDAVNKDLPAGSVIASDPLTSYSITAFTRDYTVCTFDQHAPPNDVLLEERMKAARDILSPYVPIGRTTALLADHQATHVIVNDRFPENVQLEYWSMSHDMFPSIRAKFDSHPGLFDRVLDDKGFVVYRWNGTAAKNDSTSSTPFVVDRLPTVFESVGKQAGDAILEGFHLGDDRLRGGDVVDLSFAWSGRGEYPFRNYVVAVRFDNVDPGLFLGGKPFPKIARKLKEKLTGKSYRFSGYHKIRNGFLSPDSWPGGKLVLDDTTIRVPPSAAPGDYRVTVKLLVMQHQPTYHFSDFFSDKDVYSGLAIAHVTIE
jgi:hypothetical protein